MRRLFFGLAVALCAAGLAAADDKAEAIVKKGIEAHGGADALNKYKAGRFKMKGEMSLLGMDLEFTGDLAYALPDRYRMEMSSEIMGMKLVIHQVVKGETIKSTVKIGDMTAPSGGDLEKEELKLAAAMQEAEQLTPLLDSKKFAIKAADDEDVDGKKAAVVVVTPKAIDKEVKLYFDKKSGLIVKTVHKGIGPGDGGAPVEVLEETYHSDYKKVHGVQVPTKLVVNHDGKKFLTIHLSDYELLEKIDDKEFTTDD
jgi:outer membrane lipoprotein-sorting protein